MQKIIIIEGDDANGRIPFAKRLQQKGYKVEMYASQKSSAFENSGIPYQKITINRELNPFADLKSILQIRKIIKSQPKGTIIHAFHTKQTLYLPFAAWGLKHLQIVRTITGMGRVFSGDSFKHRILQKVYNLIQKISKSQVDFTIFQNTDNHNYFLKNKLIPSNKAKLVKSSGIDLNYYQDKISNDKKESLREELKIDNGLPTVIMVSRLVKQKGVVEFLKAAKICNDKEKKFNFLLVGPVDTKKDAVSKTFVDSYSDYVQYLGRRNDVKALLSISDVFVIPTFYNEGVPRVLLEASAMGLALVSTDMPGCNDVVIDGYNGKLIKIKDEADLAEKLFFLLLDNSDLEKMKSNAIEHVKSFDLEIVTKETLDVYNILNFK